MARMSNAEKLKLKRDLSRVMRKQLSWNQREILEKLGIYCQGNGGIVNLDLDGVEDWILMKLRTELQNLLASNGQDAAQGDEDDDDQASKKALRAAMLKSRFAETISKANGGLRKSEGIDRLKKREEEEAMIKIKIKKQELMKREEKLKKQRWEEAELMKRRRQEEINKARKAARMALELVEKNVVVEDNFKVMKDYELLINGGLRKSEEIDILKKREEEEATIKIKKQALMKREEKQRREEEELKRRRQEEISKARKAVRMALELVEKNVVVEDNFKVMKDYELLINGGSPISMLLLISSYRENHSWRQRTTMV